LLGGFKLINIGLLTIIIVILILVFKSKKNINKRKLILEEILQEGFKNSSLSEASQKILDIIKKHYNANYVTIYVTNTRGLYTVASNVDTNFINGLEEYSNLLLNDMSNFKSKKKISKGGNLTYPTARERNINFSSFTPLHWEDKIIGAIFIENKVIGNMNKSSNRIKLYDDITKNITLILQNVIHYDGIISELLKDELTGVYNRRFINKTLPEQIKRHENLKLPFVISLLDIDHFKKFNDTYGHQYGDVALKQVSKFIKDNLRETDWIARYGGEEFIIFLSKTNIIDGYKRVEDIREKLSQIIISDGTTETNITASFGLSLYEASISPDELIKRADKAAYVSKDLGRNRVTVYDDNIKDIK
jgi:two-component system cell cycle response regulator